MALGGPLAPGMPLSRYYDGRVAALALRDLGEMAAAEDAWYKHLGDRLPPTTIYRCNSPLTVPACTVQYDLTAFITS